MSVEYTYIKIFIFVFTSILRYKIKTYNLLL